MPEAGKQVSIRVDEIFAADLELLARAGLSTTDAVREAVNHLAHCVNEAWLRGIVPVGTRPHVVSQVFPPEQAEPASAEAA